MTEWREAILKALAFIEEHLTEDFTLTELAAHAGYSPFYFSRLFRLLTGTTIRTHLAERRLSGTAQDIRDTRARILDIALEYGFSSQEALTRALKSAYGCTPSALRRHPHLLTLPDRNVTLPEVNQFEKGELTMNKAMTLRSINIVSADPKRLADFYRDVLGAHTDESHGGPHRIEIWFGDLTDDAVLIVANYDEGFRPQTYNACQGFEVHVPDADTEYRRLTGLGVQVPEPPKDLPWGYRYFHIKDPDGNGIDVVAKV